MMFWWWRCSYYFEYGYIWPKCLDALIT